MGKHSDDWIVLTILSDSTDAHILGSALDDSGVECMVQGQQGGGVFGRTGGLVRLKVMVRSADDVLAREVLADFDSNRENPENTHYLCDVESAGQELRDLDNLALDLDKLTLCSIGRDQRRSTIEAQLGEPEVHPAETTELRYPELGAIFALDDAERLRAFRVIVSAHPAHPHLDEYPGFWDPGSSLSPPTFEALVKRFGQPTLCHEGAVVTYDWKRSDHAIQAELTPNGKLLTFAVTFDQT